MNVTFNDRRNLAGVPLIRILWWGGYTELSGLCPSENAMQLALKMEEGAKECNASKTRKATLTAGKGKETDSLLGTSPANILTLAQWKHLFEAIKFVIICYSCQQELIPYMYVYKHSITWSIIFHLDNLLLMDTWLPWTPLNISFHTFVFFYKFFHKVQLLS